jgi:hypothetical protein
MRLSSFAPALAVAPLCLALAPRAEQITFHPRDDSKLAKKFTIKADLELGDVTFEVDGQDATGELPPDVTFGVEMFTEIVDHYIKVEDGKPLELVREFGHSKADYHALEEKDSKDDITELDGKKVRFKWNEGEKRYDLSFADGDGKTDALDGLGVDMDLRTLLPGKAVAQGDRWAVDGKGLATALLLGLDLEHMPEFGSGGGEDAEIAEMFKSDLLPQLEKFRDDFKATCEYTGQREVDGHKLAAIKIKLDVDGSIDIAEVVRKAIGSQAGGEQVELKIDDASLKLTAKGEGELLWDVGAGHAHGFEMNADLEFGAKLAMSVKADGRNVTVDGGAELLGKGSWTMALQ